MNKRREYFYGIDLIRFVSAVLVSLAHVGYSSWALSTSGGARMAQGAYRIPEIASFAWLGWVGVEIFFVISGFVIANSAERATPMAFLRSRLLRLYPAVWVCATVTALLLLSQGMLGSLKPYVFSMALVIWGPFIDGQYWTLGVEIVFYAIVFVILLMGKFRYIDHFAAFLGVISTVTLILMIFFPQLYFLQLGAWRLVLLDHGVFFAAGMLIRAWFVGRLSSRFVPIAAIVAVGTLVEPWLQARYREASDAAALAPSLVCMVAIIAIMASAHYLYAFDRLSDRTKTVLRQLGLMTYPYYLLHYQLGVFLTQEIALIGLPGLPALIASLTLVGMLSWVVVNLAEPPVRKAFARFIDYAEEAGGTRRRLAFLYRQ